MLGKLNLEKRIRRSAPAQSLVEVAILLPILLLLILGAMDFGRMFYTKIVLTNAAREGANYISRYPKDKLNCPGGECYFGTWSAIQEEGTSSGVSFNYNDVAWDSSNCCTAGSPVAITVTKSVDLIFDNFLQFMGLLGGPLVLTSTVSMVVQ